MQTDYEVMAAWVRSHYPDHRSIRDRVAAARIRNGLLSVACSVITVLTLQAFRRDRPRPRLWATGQPSWLNGTATTLAVIGVAVIVAATAYAWTSGRVREDRRSPLWALTFRQRRQVTRQATGQQPAPPGDLAFLRIVATRLSRPDQDSALAAGGILLFGGLAVLTSQPLRTLTAGLAAYLAIACAFLLRRRLLARAFLRDHPTTPDHATA